MISLTKYRLRNSNNSSSPLLVFLFVLIFMMLIQESQACTNGYDCQICANSTFCSMCLPGGGNANGVCVACSDTWHCIYCNGLVPTECLLCVQYFTVVPGNTCARITPCVNQYCIHCPNSLSDCLVCEPNQPYFGLQNLDCVQCSANCYNCTLDATNCTGCNNPYGVFNQICVICNDTNCISCRANYSDCDNCQTSFGVDPATQTCILCQRPYCSVCGWHVLACSSCISGYGLIAQDTCAQCNTIIPDCMLCSPVDVSVCTFCTPPKILVAGWCVSCIVGCDICTNLTACINCSVGYYK